MEGAGKAQGPRQQGQSGARERPQTGRIRAGSGSRPRDRARGPGWRLLRAFACCRLPSPPPLPQCSCGLWPRAQVASSGRPDPPVSCTGDLWGQTCPLSSPTYVLPTQPPSAGPPDQHRPTGALGTPPPPTLPSTLTALFLLPPALPTWVLALVLVLVTLALLLALRFCGLYGYR